MVPLSLVLSTSLSLRGCTLIDSGPRLVLGFTDFFWFFHLTRLQNSLDTASLTTLVGLSRKLGSILSCSSLDLENVLVLFIHLWFLVIMVVFKFIIWCFNSSWDLGLTSVSSCSSVPYAVLSWECCVLGMCVYTVYSCSSATYVVLECPVLGVSVYALYALVVSPHIYIYFFDFSTT